MNYIITKDTSFFKEIGEYNYCELQDMILGERISVDTECTSLEARHGKLFSIQIGTGENNYIIDLQNYCIGNEGLRPQDVFPYLKNRILVFHNALFDLGYFYSENFFPKEVRDTMLGTRILYNGDWSNIRADFGACMKRELNQFYDKTEQKNIHKVKLSQPSTIQYAFNDVDRLLELCDAIEGKIDEREQRATYDLHCRYIKALAYMELCGLPISSEEWKQKMENDLNNCSASQKLIEEYIYNSLPKFKNRQLDMFSNVGRINVSVTSPAQMLKVFQELKIPCVDRDGKNSINEDVISKSKHEFVKMWLEFQEAKHRVSTFGDGIYKQIEKERIYTNFNPMVDTARLSCRKGNINFLNFPRDKETRGCFVANKGNVIVACDYSGQENVLSADFTGDKAMTKAVIEKADLHCMLARVLFPEIEYLSDEDIIEHHSEERQASKSPRFAMNYGGNGYTIHINEGIPLERAMEIEEAYKELHSGIYVWGDRIYKESIERGYILSVDGWRLYLPKFEEFKRLKEEIEKISSDDWKIYREGKTEWKKLQEDKEYIVKKQKSFEYYKSKKYGVSQFFKLKSEYQRLALNSPIQTAGAHQIKLATCLLFEWIIENNLLWEVKICNSIYDELVLECEESLGKIVADNLSEFMRQGGNHYLTNLKIEAKAGIGDSWASAKH